MDFNPVMWALCKQSGGGSGGNSGGGNSGGGDNFPIGDGNTHIWISLAEGRTSPMLGVGVKGTVTVDWGDGSEPDTLTGTNLSATVFTPNHEYGKAGDYVITLTVSGEARFNGDSSSSYLLRHAYKANNLNYLYAVCVRKIEIGNGIVSIYESGCRSMITVDEIVIPETVKMGYSYSFCDCRALKSVRVQGETLWDSAFKYCFSAAQVFVGKSVSSIRSNVFMGCYGAALFDFSQHTSVPTLAATSAFSNVPADCIFKIPASLYDEWVAATNWSAVAATNTFVGV